MTARTVTLLQVLALVGLPCIVAVFLGLTSPILMAGLCTTGVTMLALHGVATRRAYQPRYRAVWTVS